MEELDREEDYNIYHSRLTFLSAMCDASCIYRQHTVDACKYMTYEKNICLVLNLKRTEIFNLLSRKKRKMTGNYITTAKEDENCMILHEYKRQNFAEFQPGEVK